MQMRLRASHITILVLAVVALFAASCRKQLILTKGGTLLFSTDTLAFDTVFTAEGSFTSGLLIYNPQNEEVVLSSVQLMHGFLDWRTHVSARNGPSLASQKA